MPKKKKKVRKSVSYKDLLLAERASNKNEVHSIYSDYKSAMREINLLNEKVRQAEIRAGDNASQSQYWQGAYQGMKEAMLIQAGTEQHECEYDPGVM